MYQTSFNEAWLHTLKECLGFGNTVSPRGSESKELLSHSVSFPMETAILSIPDRKLSYDFMFNEAMWILEGRNDLATLLRYANSYAQFSDDGVTLSGAYGPKVIDQFGYVLTTLLNDKHSRQAVINIWREKPGQSKDIPCTISLQFLIRDNRIHMIVNMRSNDIWLGMPYDVFSMTMIALAIGTEINRVEGWNLKLGNMYHNAGSRHLYAKNYDKAKSIVNIYDFMHTIPVSHPVLLEDMYGMQLSTLRMYLSQRSTEDYKLPKQVTDKLKWLKY